METYHLKQCPSTQHFLIKKLEESHLAKASNTPFPEVIVSTSSQIQGQGRSGKCWFTYDTSLAFSFTLKPNENLFFTSLEVAVLLKNYFLNFFNVELKLKWPNDLMTEQLMKCGGILINYLSDQLLVVGIGLNLAHPIGQNNTAENFQWGTIFNEDEFNHLAHSFNFNLQIIQELYPVKIYNYFLTNRLSPSEIKPQWIKSCFHYNQNIELKISENESYYGKFIGIGPAGEAIILDENENQHLFSSGTLIIKDY